MKKIIAGITVAVVVVLGWFGVASAHHLEVEGQSSCVREDGTWDWSATYSIPTGAGNEWANGLTVVVTWHPGSSGTSDKDFVDVSVDGAWSNGNSGGGSTKIYKGQPCPVKETTTTTTQPEETTTTVAETTTTQAEVTTTTVAETTTTQPGVVVTEPTTTTTQPGVVVTEPTTPAAVTTTGTPASKPALPPTGFNIISMWIIVIAILAVMIGALLLVKVARRSKTV